MSSNENNIKPTLTSINTGYAPGVWPFPLGGGYQLPPIPVIDAIVAHVGDGFSNVTGGNTDDTMPIIAGSNARPFDTISVYDNGVLVGSGMVDKNGLWRITPVKPLGTGSHDFTATETSSSSGLTSYPSAPVSVVIGSPSTPVAPAAPTIDGAFDAVGPIQGNIANGSQTDDTQPAFIGTGHRGDIVKLFDGSTLIGSSMVSADGRWFIKPSASLGEGPHTLHATDTNAAGLVSASSADFVVTISTGSAQTPTITGAFDHVGNHTGNIANGGQTDDARPTISGTGHAGDVIRVSDSGREIGMTTVDSNGNWSFTPDYPLAYGNHYIVAVASNAGQPASAPSAHITFTVQADKPTIDFLIDASGPVQGNVYNGGTGDDGNATLKGHGTPGDTISLSVNGLTSSFVTVDSDGTYTIHLRDLNPGMSTITARSSGGAVSDPFVYVLESSATSVPTIDYLVDAAGAVQGNISSGGSTDDVNAVLKGHSRAGDSLKVYDGTTFLGFAIVSNAGEWSFQLDNMASGTHSLHVVSYVDGAESATFPVTFGTPAAGAPTIDAIVDHAGSVQGIIAPGRATDDTRPTISGKGVNVGDIVTVADHGSAIGSATVKADGTWSFTPANPLAEGSHSITATETNPSTGVTSPASIAVSINVDTTPPTAPHLLQVIDHMGSVQGAIAAGSTTDDYQAQFRGDGVAPGDIVKAFNNGTLFGSTVADADGNWSFGPALPMANGAHDITFTATKSSTGAVSAMSDAFHYTIDATQPFVPGHGEIIPLMLNVDPQAYFAKASAHIAGGGGIDTIAFTGDHQILDLTSLTGKTAAAKISGVEVFDLGGHHNTLKVSLLDVLNLGERDLFVHDGKQQVAVKGAAGDAVDLSNTHVAGAADGQWAQHGTAQVGGVTYAVFEHSGAHVELLVQQGIATTVHQ